MYRKKTPCHPRINMSKIKDHQKCEQFNNETTKLSLALTSVNEAWCTLCDGIYNAAITVFGKSVKKNVDWFEENSLTLLPLVNEKRTAHLADKTCPSSTNRENLRTACRKMQTEARKCAQSYWLDLCDEIQKAVDIGDTRRMYEGITHCIGPVERAVPPLKDLHGNNLRGKQDTLERWVEHYGIIYTAASEINRAVLETLQQFDVMEELSTDPTCEELQQAIHSVPKHNAPGNDSIPAEMYTCADQELLSKIHQILLLCWHKEDVPQDLKDARFIQLYKSKGDRSVCDNYRGISLLSINGKIFYRILLPKLQLLEENIYPESQCGF